MAHSSVHVGDIGTILELTIKDQDGVIVDLSAITLMELDVIDPDGNRDTKTPIFKTDGTDGILQYTTVADDIDEVGEWRLQAFVRFAAGEWSTTQATFTVEKSGQ